MKHEVLPSGVWRVAVKMYDDLNHIISAQPATAFAL
jgi:hypothetical protein